MAETEDPHQNDALLALSDDMRGRLFNLFIEDEWRALAREMKDIEQSRMIVADAEIGTRQR
jgi:hypothetical protein